MALLVIIGELGSGKTCSLTYLLWRNWYYKKKIIYSNYTLYGIPYFKVETVSQLNALHNGYMGADEMWLWIESAGGERLKKEIVRNILRRSRKRNLTYAYTSQTLDQVHPHIRKINDFVAYPILNPSNTMCKLLIFAGPKGKTLLKTHYFYTAPIFKMYDTNEEIQDLIDDVTPKLKKGRKSVSMWEVFRERPSLTQVFNPTKPENPSQNPIQNQTKTLTSNEIELNIPVKQENVTLKDAEAGSVGTEEEEKYIESDENLSEKLRMEKKELMKRLKIIENKLKKLEEKEVEEEVNKYIE